MQKYRIQHAGVIFGKLKVIESKKVENFKILPFKNHPALANLMKLIMFAEILDETPSSHLPHGVV